MNDRTIASKNGRRSTLRSKYHRKWLRTKKGSREGESFVTEEVISLHSGSIVWKAFS